MARRERPPDEITLTGTERRQLQSWERRHSCARNLAMRCKTILLCEDAALTGAEIATRSAATRQPGRVAKVFR